MFNFGEYRLHNDYKHLSVSTLNWTQLNKDQKCEKLTKVFRYNAEFTNSTRHAHVPSVLSETYSALTDTNYKAHELRDVWSKAGVLYLPNCQATKHALIVLKMYTLYKEMKNWIGFLVHVLVHVITNVKTLSSSKFSVNTLLLPVKLKELCRSMYKKFKSHQREYLSIHC